MHEEEKAATAQAVQRAKAHADNNVMDADPKALQAYLDMLASLPKKGEG